MSSLSGRRVSLTQAAQVLYCTRAPSDEQLHRVTQLMKAGELPPREQRGSPLSWETTDTAVAEFMARSHMKHAIASPKTVRAKIASQKENLTELHGVYRSLWQDYFMSVFLRRRMSHRSAMFHRAVTGGQVLMLLSILVLLSTAVDQLQQFRAPPEHDSIESWIQENTDAFSIKQWHPTVPEPEGHGLLVRVEYRYRKESSRWVHTDRTFLVNGDEVEEVVLE